MLGSPKLLPSAESADKTTAEEVKCEIVFGFTGNIYLFFLFLIALYTWRALWNSAPSICTMHQLCPLLCECVHFRLRWIQFPESESNNQNVSEILSLVNIFRTPVQMLMSGPTWNLLQLLVYECKKETLSKSHIYRAAIWFMFSKLL